MKRSSVATLLATALLLGLAAAAIEATARRFAPPPAPLPHDSWSEQEYLRFLARASRPFFRLDAGTGRWSVTGDYPNDNGLRIPGFAARRPPGVRRIVIIGESSARLLGIAGHLIFGDEGGKIEIINLGLNGSSLEQSRDRMREALRYDPDAVLILFGHNLFKSHPGSALLYRLELLARKSTAISLLAERFGDKGRPDLRGEVRLELMDRFLGDAAGELSRRRVKMILCTVPSNLRFPPDALAGERLDPSYQEALLLHDLGERREAVNALERLALMRPTAYRHFVLAEWLFEGKDYDGARRHFVTARDIDPRRERATRAVNQIIRGAARRESAVLLDFDEMIRGAAPHGIPGWETFWDHQHAKPPVLSVEARAMGAALESLWPPLSILADAGPDWKESPDWTYVQSMEFEIAKPDDRWGEALAGFFQHEFAAGERSVDPALIFHRFGAGEEGGGWRQALAPLSAAEGAWRAGDSIRALELNARAAEASPSWAEAPFRRGIYLLSLGRGNEARKNLEKAVALDPARAEARALLEALERR